MSDYDNNNVRSRERELPSGHRPESGAKDESDYKTRRVYGDDDYYNSSSTRSIRELDMSYGYAPKEKDPNADISADYINLWDNRDAKDSKGQSGPRSRYGYENQQDSGDRYDTGRRSGADKQRDVYRQDRNDGDRNGRDRADRDRNDGDRNDRGRGEQDRNDRDRADRDRTGYGRNSQDKNSYRDTRGPQNARMSEARRRRKRRQKIQRVILIIVLVIVILALLGAAGYFLKKYLPSDLGSLKSSGKSGSGKVYSREIDITDAVAGNMAVWLSDLDGQDIDTLWVKDRLGQVKVTSLMLLGKDSGSNTFKETVEAESYKAMSSQVDAILNGLLSEIVADRLVKSGYAESVTADEATAIAGQVLGMSMADYIKENGVSIVPSMKELNEKYTLGSGTYETAKSITTFKSSNGSQTEDTLLIKNNNLILVESGRVYRLDKDRTADDVLNSQASDSADASSGTNGGIIDNSINNSNGSSQTVIDWGIDESATSDTIDIMTETESEEENQNENLDE